MAGPPPDIEPSSLSDWLMALLGVGGVASTGWKHVTHEHRITELEKKQADETRKGEDLSVKVAEMNGKLDAVYTGVEEIRKWIMERAK